MEQKRETLKKKLYREYGILEWDEKATTMSYDEMNTVLKDLADSRNSSLVELCKKPFPAFIEGYLANYGQKRLFENDPALGYKLFLLPPGHLRAFVDHYKGQIKGKIPNEYYRSQDIVKGNFESVVNRLITFMRSDTVAYRLKYIYLTQYIDLETAKVLQLPIATLLERDKEEDLGFEEKMKSLNTATRLIVIHALGLYGEDKKGNAQLSECLGISGHHITKILLILCQLFPRPLGEFKHGIGLVEKDYRVDETREYLNKTFRDLDIHAQASFLEHKVLKAEERIVLETLNRKEKLIYLASKYMYDTPMQVVKNLSITPMDAMKYGSKTMGE